MFCPSVIFALKSRIYVKGGNVICLGDMPGEDFRFAVAPPLTSLIDIPYAFIKARLHGFRVTQALTN